MSAEKDEQEQLSRNSMPKERLRRWPPSDPAFVGAFVGGPPQLSREEFEALQDVDPERMRALKEWWAKNRTQVLADQDEDSDETVAVAQKKLVASNG